MKPLLLGAAASLAAVLTACGTQSAGDVSLPPLHLTDAGVAAQPASAPGAGATGFELRTTLPTAAPAPAPIWRLPHGNATAAAQIAGALGLSAKPTAVPGGWVSRKAGQRLALRSDGSWSYGLDCSPGVPVEQESLDVMCASATAGGVAVAPGTTGVQPSTPISTRPSARPSPPAGPTDGHARALAAPILSRIGWGDATLDVAVGSPTTSVVATRSLAGSATDGWSTTLDFASGGTLLDGTGWVGAPSRGRSYPLIPADRAYRMLLATPRVMPEICALRKDGKPGCEPIPPTVITGAKLGVALRHDLGQPLLVPAWLFAVKGSVAPMAALAVDPRWVKPPATVAPLPLPPQSVNPAGPAVRPS